MEWRHRCDRTTVEKLSIAQLYRLWLEECGMSISMSQYDVEAPEVSCNSNASSSSDSYFDVDDSSYAGESFSFENMDMGLQNSHEFYENLTHIKEGNTTEFGNHADAEFYCFEDYIPFNRLKIEERPRPKRKHRRHGNKIKSVSFDSSVGGKSKEFQRAKTLPAIVVPKNVINDCFSGVATPEATRIQKISSVHSTDTSNPTDKSHKADSQKKRPRSLRPRSYSADRLDITATSPGKLERRKFSKTASPRAKGSAWNFDDDTDSGASSETMTTVSDSSYTSSKRATSQLYYTTPPKANMVRNVEHDQRWGSLSLSPSSFSAHGSQKDIKSPFHNRSRSISMDYGDGRPMKIYTTDDIGTDSSLQFQSSPSDPALVASRSSCCSSSSLSPSRLSRSLATTPKKKGSGSDSESSSPNKPERKKSDKRTLYDINALFDAVEHQDMDLVKIILDANGIDINCVNNECLTPLDVAVMTNNIPMAKMLLLHGAKESPLFQRHESRSSRLESLVSEAEKHVVDLTAAVLNSSAGNMSSNQQKENEKQLSHWEFRHRLLKRMKAGYDHAKKPDAPTNVSLTVASSASLLVKFDEPLNHNGAVVTKYKVEWSFNEDFVSAVGHSIVEDMRQLEKEIKNLTNGKRYYIRVAAWNMKGYGPFACSNPGYSVPSSWRDVDENHSRTMGKIEIFEELFRNIKSARPPEASEIKESSGCESPQHRKRKSLKTLFTSAPKLQKILKRGVYLASLLYNDGKVLLTAEEKLPIVEVDENYTNPSIHNEYNWMMKIACTWDDVKTLKHDLDKNSTTGSMHFRCKLLQAAQSLQNAVGLQDLGQFFHKTIKDPNGSIVLVTVNMVKDPKHVTLSSGKWMSIDRLLQKTYSSSTERIDYPDPIMQLIPDMISHHKSSSVPLPRGLYLGYVKLHCSVDLIRVLVPNRSPNVLPYVKIRECSNVSRDEWSWIQSFNSEHTYKSSNSSQDDFQISIKKAAEKLFENLGISWNLSSNHRVFDLEVVELSPSVSFLLILPSVDDVFIAPGQSDDLMERNGYQLLPVKVFEMIHMSTYQRKVNSKYSRLSSILEMDLNHAQQAQREAFLDEELTKAKNRVECLSRIQQALEKTWKSCRWVMDIITYARDRNIRGGIPLDLLLSTCDKSLSSTSYFEQLFENNNSYSSCGNMSCDTNEISVGKDNLKIAKFYDPHHDVSNSNGHIQTESTASTSGILRVHAAYNTGLDKSYSVKLYVTTKTTSKEVVSLVVQTLNKTLISKGSDGPLYSDDQFGDFCLVAVIGARERVLREDYPPLQLQNPWTKGRLFVRLRNNILAAIQHGHATAV